MRQTTKRLFLLSTLLAGIFLFQTASAQIQIGIKANIGNQPGWGPTGYDHVDYYYMPDIDAYYYVPDRQYIYLDGGHWRRSGSLPRRYNNYDINSGYKVVVNEPRPYRHADTYRAKYADYRGRHDQEIIRNSHDLKYYESKGHPEHNNWKKEHGNGHDNGNDHGNGRNGDHH